MCTEEDSSTVNKRILAENLVKPLTALPGDIYRVDSSLVTPPPSQRGNNSSRRR